MSWKIGDTAVCISKNPIWGEDFSDKNFIGPAYQEVNVVTEVYNHHTGEIALGFERYGEYVYDQSEFRKLSEVAAELSEEILEKALTSIPELV